MTSTTAGGAFGARSWPIRLLRAFAASAVSVLLAVAGHTIGGGEVAAPSLVLGVFGLILGLAFVLSGRKVTTGQIAGLLLLGQIVVHAGCMIGSEPMALGPAMLIGHLLATVTAAILLRRGETFLWALADRLGLERLQLLFHHVLLASPVTQDRGAYDVEIPRLNPRSGGVVLRGPPVSVA